MKLRLLVLLLWLCGALTVAAQNKVYKNEVGLQSDNDGFLGQGSDRYYTAGNFIYFRHALTVADTSSIKNKIADFELGQKIYTPQSGSVPGSRFIDRPFAGYLYFGAALNLLYKNESNLKLGAQLGYIGPNSMGQEVQDIIHKTFGFYTPNGWQYQITNALELNLTAQYNHLLARNGALDITANSFGNLGIGLIAAGGGFTARFGRFNPLYNSVSTASTSMASQIKNSKTTEFFIYAKPYITFVGYNATIQGDIFSNVPQANEIEGEIRPIVLSEQLGVNLVNGPWVVDVLATYQTRETKLMIHNGHQWRLVMLLYRF